MGKVILDLDSCQVAVLVDNVTDILSTVPESVITETQNVLKAGARELSGHALCYAHWGLSLVITVRLGSEIHTLLLDTGSEGYPIKRNANRLGIDLGAVESVVFSHGHWDHVGGILTALKIIINSNGGRKIPVYVNDGMFVRRAMKSSKGNIITFGKVPAKTEIEDSGGTIVSQVKSQFLFDKSFYISGEIPRITPYEKGFPGHLQTVGSKWESDPWIMDERFFAVYVRKKGIIIFSSCSHAGIINILSHAQQVFDPIPLYGVVGGLHLSGSGPETIIDQTVEDLKQFNLKMIVPGHCTGFRAMQKLVGSFGQNVVVPSAVGRFYNF